ncbi:hypothetical protein Tco_0153328 [Tanacetum coccineum]
MPTEVHSHSNPRVTHQLFTATEDSPEIQLKTTVGQSAQEMWEAIERILQGESLNIQDVKTIFILGVWSIPRLTIGERDIEALYTSFEEDSDLNKLRRIEVCRGIGLLIATLETGDSNVIPDSPDMCDNDIQDDQNDVECDNERVALANLIANLKLDVDGR